jgi:GntR family transcriptional regulator, arabinose operon transcriptional repressor
MTAMKSKKIQAVLSPKEGEPRYLAVKNLLKKQILTGRIPHDNQIPPELSLCRRYNLSRNTVQRAILDLVDEGFLVRRRGAGTFVNFQRSAVQKNLIGFLFPGPARQYNTYDEILRGVQEVAEKEGFSLVQIGTRDDPQKLIDAAIRLNHAKTVGALFIPVQGPQGDEASNEALTALVQAGQKVVVLDSQVEGPFVDKLSCITSRHLEGSYELTKYVIGLGYKRIAYLHGPHVQSGDLRLQGFLKAMTEAGLDVPPEYNLEVAARDVENQGFQEVDVFLSMRKPPEAIICLHDLIAVNVVQRCRERGIRVPEDMAVVGFDDLLQARSCNPPLTTMKQFSFEVGRRGAEVLIGHIHGEITEPVFEQIPCELMIRKSCCRKKE